MSTPLFAILNDADRPHEPLVAQYVPGVGYCYMGQATDPRLAKYNGIEADRPTALTDFGFDIVISDLLVTFRKVRLSRATYRDGRHREWQGAAEFVWPMVNAKESRYANRH